MDHSGVVISLGWNTYVYEFIKREVPDVDKLAVNVARLLPAPPRGARVPGNFPDAHIVSRIRGLEGFDTCVQICRDILEK